MGSSSANDASNARRIRQSDPICYEDLELHPELVPVDESLSNADLHVTLDAIVRAHRWQLVATARHHLGNRRQDAEDLVQDLCLEALEGQLALSSDPSDALDDLLREVVERCRGGT